MSSIHRDNFEALKRLPLFEALINEIHDLKRKNRVLKEKNRALKSVLYTFPQLFHDRSGVEIPVNIVIDRNNEQPTLCDPVVDNEEDEVQIIPPEENENIVYDLTEEDHEVTPPPKIIIKKEKNIIEDQVITISEDADPESEEEDADPTGEEAEEEEEEADPTGEEEEEEEADPASEEAEEEEEEEEADPAGEEEAEEVFVITIKGKSYYTTNEKSGTIYAIDADEEIGDEVGVFVNGTAKFNKK
jgi:hypothetical protein